MPVMDSKLSNHRVREAKQRRQVGTYIQSIFIFIFSTCTLLRLVSTFCESGFFFCLPLYFRNFYLALYRISKLCNTPTGFRFVLSFFLSFVHSLAVCNGFNYSLYSRKFELVPSGACGISRIIFTLENC